MNFHYDPILGLQYSFDEMIMVNLADVPKGFNIEELIYHIKKTGSFIIDSAPVAESVYEPKITSNAFF